MRVEGEMVWAFSEVFKSIDVHLLFTITFSFILMLLKLLMKVNSHFQNFPILNIIYLFMIGRSES